MTFAYEPADPTPILELLLTHLDDIDVNALSKRFTEAGNMLEWQLQLTTDNFKIIDLLVAKGATLSTDTNILNKFFSSQYSEATPGGGYIYDEEAKILLKKLAYILDKYPALINKKDPSGSYPIHSAIDQMHSAEAVKLLIEKGADLIVKNSEEKHPKELAELFVADDPEIIKVFAEKSL